MPKGRHRRHREARQIKFNTSPAGEGGAGDGSAELCVECGRDPHAEWCLAEAPDEFFQ